MDRKKSKFEDDEKSLISHNDGEYNREKRTTSFFIKVEKWKSNYSIQFHFTTHLIMSNLFYLFAKLLFFLSFAL